jgi:HEXXH motif-containing protein
VQSLPELLSKILDGERNLWFPGLAVRLVEDFWAKMHASADGAIYTTQGWLGGVADVPAADVRLLRLGRYLSRLETLPAATRRSFPDLLFVEAESAALAPQLRAAAEILTCVDGLVDSLGCLVRSIHVLRAPLNHDVSHSTPALPFSVFVSVPGADESDATLRLAESLVHEAMHLQLTLIDRTGALVIDRRRHAYSPWKEDSRPLEGLLHGLYVFAVIHQVLDLLAEAEPRSRSYFARRRIQIGEEVAGLPQEPDGLSRLGGDLWRRCFASVSSA